LFFKRKFLFLEKKVKREKRKREKKRKGRKGKNEKGESRKEGGTGLDMKILVSKK